MWLRVARERLGRWYRQTVPLSLRVSLREEYARRTGRGSGVVSVVLPIRGDEPRLDECLQTVRTQTYAALEIIVVDGGATENAHATVSAHARTDSRIRIAPGTKSGVAAARDTGLAGATGRFVCFVDSNDLVPSGAVADMVRSLRTSGSDFVLGVPLRTPSGDGWPTAGAATLHMRRQQSVTLDDFPTALHAVTVRGKLFDTEFLRRVAAGFTQGTRYSDQLPSIRAYLAGRFDVRADRGHHWYVREDTDPVGQHDTELAALRDQLAVADRVAAILATGAASMTYRQWLVRLSSDDLRRWIEYVPLAGVEYFQQLRAEVRAVAERMPPTTWSAVPILDRIPVLAVLAGARDDVTTAVVRRQEYGWFFPTTTDTGTPLLRRSYLAGMRLPPPDEQLRPAQPDIRLVAVFSSLWWHGSTLRLAGYAYLTNLPYDPDTAATHITVVSAAGERVPMPVERRRDPRIDIESKDAWNEHGDAGFVVDIDPTQLPDAQSSRWWVEVSVTVAALERSTLLGEYDHRGIAATQPVAATCAGLRWSAGIGKDHALQLRRHVPTDVAVTSIRCHGRDIALTVDDPAAHTLVLHCRSLHRTLEIPVRSSPAGHPTIELTLPELVDDEITRSHVWSAWLHGGDETPRRLTYQGDADDLVLRCPEHATVRATMTPSGTLRFTQDHWRVVADAVSTDGDTLTVTGRLTATHATEINATLAADSQVIEATETDMDPTAETFLLRFRLANDMAVSTSGPGFTLRVSLLLDRQRQERTVRTSLRLQHQLPVDHGLDGYNLTLSRTRRVAGLRIRVRPPYQSDERGRLAQRRLHEHFHTPASAGGGLRPELRDAVLFETFRGKQIGDSVLALFYELRSREPALQLFWSVRDYSMPVPEGATPLLVDSREWMDVLHHARYLVNNSRFKFYFRKRSGQSYIQTWHGTPLKRLGNDAPVTNFDVWAEQRRHRETAYWDVLLAQNDFAAETLVDAYGYRGSVLNLGYPRNDALVDTQAAQRRKRARAELGITEQQRVVLYAPTWRDDIKTTSGYTLVSYLDFPAAQHAAGADTIFLLRGHYYTVRQQSTPPAGVLDVTDHHDVNDLILASDVLITDYSSLMFDYAATGKPMLFLTPDLAEYRGVTRGFYLDFEDIAPGPICRSNDELCHVLEATDLDELTHTAQYYAFVRRFAPRDDGAAAQRVVDALCARYGSSACH